MLITVVTLSILIAYIPIISKYTALVNTFIHEIGHATVAILTFGEVYKIRLNTDTSGYAVTGSRWWMGRVLTTLAGYPFSLLFPSVMIYMILHDKPEIVLWTLIILLSLSIILWIRDFLSLIWCISILAILIGVIHFHINVKMAMIAVMTISLSSAARSTYDIFILSIRQSESSGDAYSLFKSTLFPPQLWGLLFLLMGIAIPIYTIGLVSGHAPDYYKPIINFVDLVRQVRIKL